MQQPMARSMRQIETLVRHGIQELREGTTLEHTLAEVALMGAMVGAGATANQAIRTVERLEAQLLGGTGRERGETMYHPGGMVQQGYVQPGMFQQGLMQPGLVPQAYGKPGMLQQGFAQPGMVTQGYGKQMPMTYSPLGTTWMGK